MSSDTNNGALHASRSTLGFIDALNNGFRRTTTQPWRIRPRPIDSPAIRLTSRT
jgi:hypothetical protein